LDCRGAEVGVLRRQGGHFAFQLGLHGPARHGLELVQRAHRRAGLGGLGRRVAQAVHKGQGAVQHAHHGGARQFFLGSEQLVQAGLGHAGLGRHLVHRHGVVALGGQQPVDGRHDGLLAHALYLFFDGGAASHSDILDLAGHI